MASFTLALFFIFLSVFLLIKGARERSRSRENLIKVQEEREIDDARRSAIIELQYQIAAGTTDIDGLMDLVLKRVENLTAAAGAVIEMIDGNEMVYRAASGSASLSVGIRLKSETSLSGKCVAAGQALLCKDSAADNRVDREACERIGARSMVVVPLRNIDKIVGVLKVYSPTPRTFSEKDVSDLELISGFLGVMLERAETADELRKSQHAANEASQIKSKFLANMSHEIRTPLNGVMGIADLLLEITTENEHREYAQHILSSAETLLILINDILDLSKAEAGKLVLENIFFDLHLLLTDVEKTLSFSAKKKGLFLSNTLSEGPNFFHGDPTKLKQILINLINNAIKFTEHGGVTIKVRKNLLEDFRYKVRFEIEDTGIGIPDSALGKMFQPFSQVDASTTRRFGGTGLGLSICKGLVDLMGGKIGVESFSGKGSHCWFEVELESTLAFSKTSDQ